MDEKKEYRIKEYLDKFTIQIKYKNEWCNCNEMGDYIGLYLSPVMIDFESLLEAEQMLKKLINGPKYYYPELLGLNEDLSINTNNFIFHKITESKDKLNKRIEFYNNLPWYKKIFVFEL